jgi:hypothetical protein
VLGWLVVSRRRTTLRLGLLVAVAVCVPAAAGPPDAFAAPRHSLATPWKGTMESDAKRVYVSESRTDTCTDHFHSDLAFSVAGKVVSGHGQAVLTSGPACTFPLVYPSMMENDFTIGGTADATSITLVFTSVGSSPAGAADWAGWITLVGRYPYQGPQVGPPLVIPRNGCCKAAGTVVTTDTIPDGGGPDSLSATNVISLTATCDPNLMAKALREYETATSFAQAGVKEINAAGRSLQGFGEDYAKESLEVGGEKFTLLQILHSVDAGFELDLAQIAELTGVGVAIGVTLEELLFKFYPEYREYKSQSKAAQADFNRAKQWAARGAADLKTALAGGPCLDPVEGRLNKLLDDRDKEDKARRLIDSWEHSNSVYRDPASGDILDEAAALKRARAALRSGSSGRLLQAVGVSTKAKLTARQVRSAAGHLRTATAKHASAKSRIGHLRIASTTLRNGLRPLLSG